MSNKAKMTLEEKLVQRIKDDTLMMAVGDEDMLTDLVKRALHEALFQERTVNDGYGRTRKEPSLVVTEAKAVAGEACTAIAKEIFTEVVNRPEVRKAINDAMPSLVLDALGKTVAFAVTNVVSAASHEAEHNIREAIRNNNTM